MKQLFTIFNVLIIGLSFAQENLVSNPSFENINDQWLPCGYIQSTLTFEKCVKNWTSPTASTPDIFSKKADISCPNNPDNNSSSGSQKPRTGNNFTAILVYVKDNPGYKEYIQTKLKINLTKGSKYFLSYFVSLDDKSKYCSNNLGMAFENFEKKVSYYDNISSLDLAIFDPKFKNNSTSWVEIKGAYTAKDTFSHLIIGNFHNFQDNYNPIANEGDVYGYADYYIDDVSVYECSKFLGKDTVICGEKEFLLDATLSIPNSTYSWQDGSTESTFIVVEPGTYSVNTNNQYCTETNNIDVSFSNYKDCPHTNFEKLNFHIPNIITPNNDGINDSFKITTPYRDVIILQIYNQWGELVFEDNNYLNDWDGKGLRDGVYYYKVIGKLFDKSYKGWLQILR